MINVIGAGRILSQHFGNDCRNKQLVSEAVEKYALAEFNKGAVPGGSILPTNQEMKDLLSHRLDQTPFPYIRNTVLRSCFKYSGYWLAGQAFYVVAARIATNKLVLTESGWNSDADFLLHKAIIAAEIITLLGAGYNALNRLDKEVDECNRIDAIANKIGIIVSNDKTVISSITKKRIFEALYMRPTREIYLPVVLEFVETGIQCGAVVPPICFSFALCLLSKNR